MKCLSLAASILAFSVSVACVSSQPDVDLGAEEETIRKLTTNWFADETRRDMEASLSYLAPNAVIQPEGGPTLVGIDAMRSLYEELFKIPYTDLVMQQRTVVVASSGDLAYDIGPWKMVSAGPDVVIETPGKSTLSWRKLDGQWKCVVMSFSMDTPAGGSSD